jgi:hypothetical protein
MKIFLKYLLVLLLINRFKATIELTEEDTEMPEEDSTEIEEPFTKENTPEIKINQEPSIKENNQIIDKRNPYYQYKVLTDPDGELVGPHEQVKVDGDWVKIQKDFQEISRDYRKMQKDYEKCLDDLEDIDYTQQGIKNCIGVGYSIVVNRANFEKKKLIGKYDLEVREFLFKECYQAAGQNEDWASGCDSLQKDIMDFLWYEMNFNDIINFHRDKYIIHNGRIPIDVFDSIMYQIDKIYKRLFDLLNEVDAHQDLLIIELKTYVDKRTQEVKKKILLHNAKPKLKFSKKVITIKTLLNNPAKVVDPEQLPYPVPLDGSTRIASKYQRPETQKLIDLYRYNKNHQYNMETLHLDKGPVVSIPDHRQLLMKSDKKYF